MKKVMIAALAAVAMPAMAQNLIVNGSFEQDRVDPTVAFSLFYATGWDVTQLGGVYQPQPGQSGCANDATLYDTIDGNQLGFGNALAGRLSQNVGPQPTGIYRLSWLSVSRCNAVGSYRAVASISDNGGPLGSVSYGPQDGQAINRVLEVAHTSGGDLIASFAHDASSSGQFLVDIVTLERVGDLPNPVVPVACNGFLPPLADGAVKARKGRTIPAKLMADVPYGAAAPVISILFNDPSVSGGIEVELDSIGAASEGNQMVLNDYGEWQLNFMTKAYIAQGTYDIVATAGDDSYELVGCSVGQFVK